MNRLNFVLVLVLTACALSLVSSQYQARRLFMDLEAAQSAARRLDTEWSQLQVDQTTWSKHGLIESAAVKDLRMQSATPAKTQYVTVQGAAGALLPASGSADASPRRMP